MTNKALQLLEDITEEMDLHELEFLAIDILENEEDEEIINFITKKLETAMKNFNPDELEYF